MSDKPALVVGEPELVKAIMVKDFHIFPQRRGTDTSHPILKKNIFTSTKMRLMYPQMEECLNDFMVHLDDLAKTKTHVNFKEIYGNFTLDVIASCFFATKLNSLNELDCGFVKHAKILLAINPLKMLVLRILPKSMFRMIGVNTERNTATEESQRFYVDLVRQMIDKRKESGEKVNDFLQILIDAEQSIANNDDEIDSESHHVNEGIVRIILHKTVFRLLRKVEYFQERKS